MCVLALNGTSFGRFTAKRNTFCLISRKYAYIYIYMPLVAIFCVGGVVSTREALIYYLHALVSLR